MYTWLISDTSNLGVYVTTIFEDPNANDNAKGLVIIQTNFLQILRHLEWEAAITGNCRRGKKDENRQRVLH